MYIFNYQNTKSFHLVLSFRSPDEAEGREIFMYDVATQSVSKLSGELSSAFVDAAEANTENDSEDSSGASSNLVEIRVRATGDRFDTEDEPNTDLAGAPSENFENRIPLIDAEEFDLSPGASEQLESFIDISGPDLTAADTKNSVERELFIETNKENS